jgi:hypothetical protein
MNRLLFISLLSTTTLMFLYSCTSDEIGSSKDVNPDAVYFDYKVSAEENNPDVTINLQYRMGGKNGTTLVLDGPSKAMLDNEPFMLDSAKLMGAYYELQKPVTSFEGKHTITFTDLNKKEYKEEFEFIPFTIDPDVPATLTRGDLVFNFKGFAPVDHVQVIMTDTSYTSDDINDIDTVKNGQLVIKAERLSKLVNGPINLQLYREVEKPIKSSTKEGGRLIMTYGLKRDFVLKDPVIQ